MVATVAILASARQAIATADPALVCSRRIERTAVAKARVRERVLARCTAAIGSCPGALSGGTSDACLTHAGARCRARLDGLTRLASLAARVAAACSATLAPERILHDDLAFVALAPYCPRVRFRAGIPEDAFACQANALTCTASATVAVLAPRMAELLARAGVSLRDAPGCTPSSLCGNGVTDADEECDDGPANGDLTPDACRTTCLEADCGDGIVDDGEECDDGNLRDGDGCDADCFFEEGACGNGVVDDDEECDDGNLRDGDGCDAECFLEAGHCGDGVVDDDEECDDALLDSDTLPDRCRTDCTTPYCGDGVVDPSDDEQCEPPGTIACTDDCQVRLPLSGATATHRAGSDLAACQRALLTAGLRVATRVRTIVGRCVDRLARCAVGIAHPADACLAGAERVCANAAAARARALAKLTVPTSARCHDDAGAPALLAADGLGFAATAAACPFHGPGTPTSDDLVSCVLDRARCMGERLVGIGVPSAYDLLDTLDADPRARFPCVLDPDDLGSGFDPRDPASGRGSPSGAFVDGG